MSEHLRPPARVQVEVDGPIRIVRLNRPDDLNATNHELHEGWSRLCSRSSTPTTRRAPSCSPATAAPSPPAVTSSTSTSSRSDPALRERDARRRPPDRDRAWPRAACPIVAAVNGPAVGLGCSLVALSDIVYMAESAHLADPHVARRPRGGRRRADHLAAADEPAAGQGVRARPATGSRPSGPRQIGLVNHVCPDDEVFDQAMACAQPDRQAAAAGGRGHQAHPQPPPRASRRWPRSTSRSPPRTARSPPLSSGRTSPASAPTRADPEPVP